MRVLLLVDFSNVLFRVTAKNKESTCNSKFTGGLSGFVKYLAHLLHKFEPTDILVCRDLPPYLRKHNLPEYKEGRKSPIQDLVLESVPYCETLLEVLGVTLWGVPGLEADDLMSLAVEGLEGYDRYIIVSNDSDLYQLLDVPGVFLYRKGGLYGIKKFREEFGVEPHQWVLVNALSGGHNGVGGIDGVGVKTAIKMVKKRGEYRDVFREHRDLIRRNKYLNLLPFPDIPDDFDLQPPSVGKYSERELVKFLRDFGISIRGGDVLPFELLEER